MNEIYMDLEAGQQYILLDEATNEKWIVAIDDNYKPGQKPEGFEVFYKVLYTNTDREIKDSEGDSAIECFIEGNRLRVFKLERDLTIYEKGKKMKEERVFRLNPDDKEELKKLIKQSLPLFYLLHL